MNIRISHTSGAPRQTVRLIAVLVPLMLLCTGWTAPLNGQGFRVVVHQNNPVTSLTKAELSRLFLKQTTRWSDGQIVQPVDLRESSAARTAFSQNVHGRPVAAIKVFWQQQIFAGQGVPPLEKRSDEEVMQFVADNPAAIGYVSQGATVGSTLRVVTITN